jgi:hypothetical protein
MLEVVRVLDRGATVDGTSYRVQVCGRPAGHVWEGWIEFETADRGWLRTPRETTQPDRAALHYWAGGLSLTYFEGALRRALAPPVTTFQPPPSVPQFAGPAGRALVRPEPREAVAILDPYSVGAKGEALLRNELGALRGWHLRNIIRAYQLADSRVNLEALSEIELVDLIVTEVMQEQRA